MTDDSDEPDDESVAGIRETAPMSEYGRSAVGLGLIVFLIGMIVAFALPVLGTL
ncbi:DUF7550 family protein [Halovivax gelatinilyticus]|uniref:DUF7550 family protein n=1 Tax=Halovivax gelatinilyticus TaxID=2961597 RepID=UPI0020CA323A|nr:hypothetical protein [Halovivax gelatinilyticus]